MRRLILTALLIVMTALPLHARGLKAAERDSWKGTIGSEATVRINNPWGDIRLRHGGDGCGLEVAVIFQQLADDGSKLVLDVALEDGIARVSILRHDELGNPSDAPPSRVNPRADVAVLVPTGHPIRAETSTGLVEAQGLHCDLDLHTTAGTVRTVTVRGAINSTNDRGATEITLSDGVTTNAQRFSSITGPITVFASEANDLAVTMSTSGRLTTDFTLVVDHNDAKEPSKNARATIGEGGAVLDLASKRGDLALRRLVTPDTD